MPPSTTTRSYCDKSRDAAPSPRASANVRAPARRSASAASAVAAKTSASTANTLPIMRRLAILSTIVLVAGCGGGGGGSTTSTGATTTSSGGVRLGPAFGSFASLPGVQNTPPPWNPGNGPALKPRLLAMGLQPLSQEGAVVHIHQHLDIYVDGRKVTLPASIGISATQQFIS